MLPGIESKTLCGVVFAAAFFLAPGLNAESPNFSLTETFSFVWHGDNRDREKTNDDYFDFKNRLNLSFISRSIETALRMDTMTIFDYNLEDPDAPAEKKYHDDYRLERLTGIIKPWGNFRLTLGDFYAQLGNGILLSLRKIDEFGSETVMRGGRIELNSSIAGFAAMGGVTNINNINEIDNYFYEDPMDRVVAGKLYIKAIKGLKFEVMGLLLSWHDLKLNKNLMLTGTGALFEVAVLPSVFNLCAETDIVWREKMDRKGESVFDNGEAVYFKMNALVGRVSTLLELKWYEKMEITGSRVGDKDIVYNQPPTAERVDQEIESISTVYGGRLKTDIRISDTFNIYANFSGGQYAPLTDVVEKNYENRGNYYIHTYGGLTMFASEGKTEVSLGGGWRKEMEPASFLSDEEDDWSRHAHIYHIEAKTVFFIKGGWSLHYSLLHEIRGKAMGLSYNDYERGTHIVGVDLSGVFSLSAAFEYDTEYHKMPFTDNLYGWGEARFYPFKGFILLVKGGIEKGGLKCVSGICQTLPPFSGLKLNVIYRY